MTELFKSDFFTVSLSDTPAVKGHLSVVNSKPLSLCNNDESALFFSATSTCATALFETLGAHGTNIIITETDTSLQGAILARMQNDGLDFLWQPTRGDSVQLDSVAKSIKDEIDILIWQKNNPETKPDNSNSLTPELIKQPASSDSKEKKDNYLLKKLTRTP